MKKRLKDAEANTTAGQFKQLGVALRALAESLKAAYKEDRDSLAKLIRNIEGKAKRWLR